MQPSHSKILIRSSSINLCHFRGSNTSSFSPLHYLVLPSRGLGVPCVSRKAIPHFTGCVYLFTSAQVKNILRKQLCSARSDRCANWTSLFCWIQLILLAWNQQHNVPTEFRIQLEELCCLGPFVNTLWRFQMPLTSSICLNQQLQISKCKYLMRVLNKLFFEYLQITKLKMGADIKLGINFITPRKRMKWLPPSECFQKYAPAQWWMRNLSQHCWSKGEIWNWNSENCSPIKRFRWTLNPPAL